MGFVVNEAVLGVDCLQVQWTPGLLLEKKLAVAEGKHMSCFRTEIRKGWTTFFTPPYTLRLAVKKSEVKVCYAMKDAELWLQEPSACCPARSG